MRQSHRVMPESVLITPEAAHEAVVLRAYCESRYPVGESSDGPYAVTGEENHVLTCEHGSEGYLSPAGAREKAQAAFDEYANGRDGTLYWRIVPEIALNVRKHKYVYYLRLLISDKDTILKKDST